MVAIEWVTFNPEHVVPLPPEYLLTVCAALNPYSFYKYFTVI